MTISCTAGRFLMPHFRLMPLLAQEGRNPLSASHICKRYSISSSLAPPCGLNNEFNVCTQCAMPLNIFPCEFFNLDVPLCEASTMLHMGAKTFGGKFEKTPHNHGDVTCGIPTKVDTHIIANVLVAFWGIYSSDQRRIWRVKRCHFNPQHTLFCHKPYRT
jgi:hypothetical protein